MISFFLVHSDRHFCCYLVYRWCVLVAASGCEQVPFGRIHLAKALFGSAPASATVTLLGAITLLKALLWYFLSPWKFSG